MNMWQFFFPDQNLTVLPTPLKLLDSSDPLVSLRRARNMVPSLDKSVSLIPLLGSKTS